MIKMAHIYGVLVTYQDMVLSTLYSLFHLNLIKSCEVGVSMTILAMGGKWNIESLKQLEEGHSAYSIDNSMICPVGIADQLNPALLK